jgi:hypothetical protein
MNTVPLFVGTSYSGRCCPHGDGVRLSRFHAGLRYLFDQALKSGPLAQKEPVLGGIRWLLTWLVEVAEARYVVVQWVPGHVGIQMMITVDAYAEELHRIRARQVEYEQAAAPQAGVKVALGRAM